METACQADRRTLTPSLLCISGFAVVHASPKYFQALELSRWCSSNHWKSAARLLCAVVAFSLHAETTSAFKVEGNPLFDGADPDVLLVGDAFWVYPTGSGSGDDAGFHAYSSRDLRKWTRHGPVLSFRDVRWIGQDGDRRHYAWAPGLLARGGMCYLYYSVGPNRPTPSRIGVAVGRDPAGPFVDSGRPLVTGSTGFEAIDAMPFAVPGSRRVWLYCGGSDGARLKVFELSDDLLSVRREIEVETPPRFTEGAFMHEHAGRFYLSYSHGNYRDASYSVHYCTAPSPEGPWHYEGRILASDEHHLGPGHHAIVRAPGGRTLIFYHRWNGAARTGRMPAGRSVCVEELRYAPDGTIRPVVMTEGAAK